MSILRQPSDLPFPVLAEVVVPVPIRDRFALLPPCNPSGLTKMAGRVTAFSTPREKWLSQPVVAKDVASGENKPTSHL